MHRRQTLSLSVRQNNDIHPFFFNSFSISLFITSLFYTLEQNLLTKSRN